MGKTPRPSRKGIELKPAGMRKRHNIAFRVNDALRAQLQKEADAAQRSVSEQIEYKLQLADDVAALLEAAKEPVTRELFRSLSQALSKVRSISRNKGRDELETRGALRAAFDHIGDVYFWQGQEISLGPVGNANKPPVHTADKPPEEMGWEVAEWALFWNDDLAREEFEAGRISTVWSGDGSESAIVAERGPQGPPLSEILRGDNRPDPVAPAGASEPSAKSVRRRRFSSLGPRFYVRRDHSRAHQTSH